MELRERGERMMRVVLAIGFRQIQTDRRAVSELARNGRKAAGLPGESIHHRQPQSRSLPKRLRGEKRLERLPDDIGRHALARIGHGDANKTARLQLALRGM